MSQWRCLLHDLFTEFIAIVGFSFVCRSSLITSRTQRDRCPASSRVDGHSHIGHVSELCDHSLWGMLADRYSRSR
jgi:hypothetical protein